MSWFRRTRSSQSTPTTSALLNTASTPDLSSIPAVATQQPSPVAQFRQILYAFKASKLLFFALDADLFAMVMAGPEQMRSAAEIAAAKGWNEANLFRIMQALAANGLLQEDADHRFSLTPVSQLLMSNPGFMAEAQCANLVLSHAWDGLMPSVETGKPAFDTIYQTNFFHYLGTNPEIGRYFGQFMNAASQQIAHALVATYDFSQQRQLVDIGGNVGTFSLAILQANPQMQAIVFDRPDAIARSHPQQYIDAANLTDRCTVAAGDFFQAVPAGADTYLLSQVLHDFADEQCKTILANCRGAMTADGKILIVETVKPEYIQAPSFAVDQDLNMLVLLAGRERTEQQYEQLLAGSGLQSTQITPIPPFSIITATKIP